MCFWGKAGGGARDGGEHERASVPEPRASFGGRGLEGVTAGEPGGVSVVHTPQ
jgi:hypothetical protein